MEEQKDIQSLISAFEETWSALDAYDKDAYTHKEHTSAQFSFTEENFRQALGQFKQFLFR